MATQKPGAVPAGANPWVRLAAAMAVQAVRDLRSKDVMKRFDALAWFINGEAEIVLTAIDSLPPGDVLQKVVNYEY